MPSNKPLNKNYGHDANFLRHVVNEMEEIVYVSDPVSYDLLYLNDFGKKMFNLTSCEGKKCYEVFHKHSAPCPFCKNEFLTTENFYVWDWPDQHNRQYVLRDKLIHWDNRLLKLGIANSVIHYELMSQRIQLQLKNKQILLKCIYALGSEEEFSEAVEIILKHLGQHYQAERAFIFEYRAEEDGTLTATNTHEWCAENASPHMKLFQNVPVDHFSLWKNQIEHNCHIILESAEEIRDDHPNDYRFLKEHGVERMMLIPLNVDDKVTGFIGIDNPKTPVDDYSLLNSLALVVANEQRKREMERKLREMSYTDKLTDLGNRNNYMRTLEQLAKTPPPNLGVVFIDLNGLKMVNDRFGHDAGDDYIKNLANVFRKHFREEDIYRIGGDEFVFLTQRIREPIFLEKIEALKKEAHALYPDSISLGHVWREKSIRPANMVKKADFLMYEDKKEYYRRRDAAAST